MRLKKISWRNFKSYSNILTEIPFTNNASLNLIIGENGTGKSSISEVITYTLYGKIDNIKNSDIPNRINKNFYSKIELDCDGHELIIERGLNPSIFEIHIDGKRIDTAGKTTDANKLWDNLPEQDKFIEAMADAASVVHNKFKGNIAYINVMKNMSVDCDCCAVAEDPCIADIGVLASTDPIAIDQACIDLVYASSDPGKPHLLERIESRNGVHTIEAAAALGFGTRDYELIEVE